MKTKFEQVVFKDHADWLARRRDMGIGGSETGALLGLNQYQCSAQLFYNKVGLSPEINDNMRMLMGREKEPLIAKLWQYFDPADGWDASEIEQSIVKNYAAKRRVRLARSPKFLAKSIEYPWLFASMDRTFNDKENGKSVLEIKTINGFESRKWEGGIPPQYVIQIQHYLLVTGYKYAELAVVEDGSRWKIERFYPSETIFQSIIDATSQFWNDVLEARNILAFGGTENDIQHLVPPPDGSPAYEEFLKDKYKNSDQNALEIEADDRDVLLVAGLIESAAKLDEVKREEALWRQRLKDRIGDLRGLQLGKDYGKVLWSTDKNGTRTFRTNGVKKEALIAKAQEIRAAYAEDFVESVRSTETSE